jgi:hypothetical protein
MGDIEINQRYFNRIDKMVGSPVVEFSLVLPEKVFLSFNFDRFIYIKHKDLQGYFFVEKIQNYKDGSHLVRVDMLCIDPVGMINTTAAVQPGGEFILMETSGNVLQEDSTNILIEV